MRSTSLQRHNHPVLHLVHLLGRRRHVNLLRRERRDELELVAQILVVHAARGDLIQRQIRLAARDGLDQRVVQEDVLLLGLHEEVALRADVPEEAEDVQQLPMLDLLEHRVEHDVRPGSPDAGAAVHDDRPGVLRIGRRGLPHEVQHRQRMVWSSMVRPVRIVVLIDELLRRELLLLLQLEVADLERAHGVRRHHFLLHHLHLDHAVRLGAVLRPVHVALAPSTLHQVRYHDDNGDTLFPYHSPKAIKRTRQRALRPDKSSRLSVAINEVGVDVIVLLLLARRFTQLNA